MGRASDPLDTYLLRVLCTLLAERSVSRTAIRLNQSQPAISAALKRLREIFNDQLLVRGRDGLVPTERAAELREPARLALSEIERLFVQREHFEPASTQQTFRIGSPDFLAASFLAHLAVSVRRQAPHARVVVQSLGPDLDYEQALATGGLDIVIGNWPEPPEGLRLSLLLEDELVCVMGADNPLARTELSVDAYLQAPHIAPMPYSVAQRGVVETHLASLRLERNVRMVLPFFAQSPYLLPGTDLIFTTARHFAEHYAALLPLVIRPTPLDFPRMRFYQLWHDRTHYSASHRWLRGLLGEAGDRLRAQRPPARG